MVVLVLRVGLFLKLTSVNTMVSLILLYLHMFMNRYKGLQPFANGLQALHTSTNANYLQMAI